MSNTETDALVYTCSICKERDQSPFEYAPRLAICTDCWYGYLTGSERKAIAKRSSVRVRSGRDFDE